MDKRRIKIGLRNLSAPNIILKARAILEGMTSNANFPTPNPDLTVYAAAVAELTAVQTQLQAAGGGKDLTNLRNTALETVKDLTRQLASYVDNVANGIGDIILSSGFELQNVPSPIGFLSPPELKVVFGEGQELQIGVLRAYHRGVKGRTSYVYRIRKVTDEADTTNRWLTTESPARSYTITELESCAQYELQVAVRSSAGVGGYSASVYRWPQ